MSERKVRPKAHEGSRSKELKENGFAVLLETVVLTKATAPERKHHIKVSGFMVVDSLFPVGFQAWRTEKDGNWMVLSPYSIFSCFPTSMTDEGKLQLQGAIGDLSEERAKAIAEKTEQFKRGFRLTNDEKSPKQKRECATFKEVVKTIADHKKAQLA